VANTYTVSPADVAAELPGLYPGGFSATSVPTTAQVQALIDTADLIVTLQIKDSVGLDPSNTDRAAPIAKRFIIETVKAQVLRIIYVGKDPAFIAGVAGPYDVIAKGLLSGIVLMGQQVIGTGEAAPLIVGNITNRDLILCSDDLDPDTRGRF
jgi:predicted aspartyl protease